MPNIIAVIPAHLESVRLKRKILIDLLGIPMIEHVRRRVSDSNLFDKVIVATGDDQIISTVTAYGGEVQRTFKNHLNGTSRVAEAVEHFNCSHVVIIQGDEPLITKDTLLKIKNSIKNNPEIDSWNCISNINNKEDLNRINIVKASINEDGKILYCFRKSPSVGTFQKQTRYIKKIQGLIAFKKDVLLKLSHKKISKLELVESIEQLKILNYGFSMYGILQKEQVPSINEESDLKEFYDYLKNNKAQNELTKRLINSTRT